MSTKQIVNGITQWKVSNVPDFSTEGSTPRPLVQGGNCSGNVCSTYTFSLSGTVIYVRLITFDGTHVSYPDCIKNKVKYLLGSYLEVSSGNYQWYFLNWTPNSGFQTFSLEKLTSGVQFTYFTLPYARQYEKNYFVVSRDGESSTVGFNLIFNNGEPVLFQCNKGCSCGSGYTCDSVGNCLFLEACQSGHCGGECEGTCEYGECEEVFSGTWACVVDCQNSPCGGSCRGDCPEGLVCEEIGVSGNYSCLNPCLSGECNFNCLGTCPEGQTCQGGPGNYSCKSVCSGTCDGQCPGTCSEGICTLQDGKYVCLVEKSLISQWQFWLIIIGSILLLILLIWIIYKLVRKSRKTSQVHISEISPETELTMPI